MHESADTMPCCPRPCVFLIFCTQTWCPTDLEKFWNIFFIIVKFHCILIAVNVFLRQFFDAQLLWDNQSNLSNKMRHPIRTSSSTALFMACCESLPKNKFYYLSHFKTLTGAIKDNRNRLDRTIRPGIMSTAGMI